MLAILLRPGVLHRGRHGHLPARLGGHHPLLLAPHPGAHATRVQDPEAVLFPGPGAVCCRTWDMLERQQLHLYIQRREPSRTHRGVQPACQRWRRRRRRRRRQQTSARRPAATPEPPQQQRPRFCAAPRRQEWQFIWRVRGLCLGGRLPGAERVEHLLRHRALQVDAALQVRPGELCWGLLHRAWVAVPEQLVLRSGLQRLLVFDLPLVRQPDYEQLGGLAHARLGLPAVCRP
mmetsp:Transcript_850/g.1784  ORF Transcript_850/g.1784 Transcript_850/m.1784 type:complete len:233 (+) Transcript_850:154-852(+)